VTNINGSLLDCDIAPRALNYSLRDYHHAGYEGPLNAMWKDKPHRLLYDLIAAVRFYAAQTAAQAEPVTFAAICDLMPPEFAWGEPCTPGLVKHIIEQAHGIGGKP
jgi:hypothetical protein